MGIILDALQLGLVEVQPSEEAAMQLIHLSGFPAVLFIGLGLGDVPKRLHGNHHTPDDLLVRLGPLP